MRLLVLVLVLLFVLRYIPKLVINRVLAHLNDFLLYARII